VSAALHFGEVMALLVQLGSCYSLLFLSLYGWLLRTRLTCHVCMADRAYSLSRFNSELIASDALIVDGDVDLPTLLVRMFLDFLLLSRRSARCSLSELFSRQRVYGFVDALGLGGVSSILLGSVVIFVLSWCDKRCVTIGAELKAAHAVVLGIGPLNVIYSMLAPRVLKLLRLVAREFGAVVVVSFLQLNYEIFHLWRARNPGIRFLKPSYRGPSADITFF
jgi:hypothetical protein